MTCPHDIIFHNTNVGTDADPKIAVYVSCDQDARAGGCGFSVPFHDSMDEAHDAYDFWVTSSDFRRYEALHQQHAKDTND